MQEHLIDVADDAIESHGDRFNPATRLTSQHRASAQRELERLLDKLSKDLAAAGVDSPDLGFKLHRSPGRCVMQGSVGAVSVSWFPAQLLETWVGDLQVIEWQGVVTFPGSAPKVNGKATVVEIALFHLVRAGDADWGWQPDGEVPVITTEALAVHCLGRLRVQGGSGAIADAKP